MTIVRDFAENIQSDGDLIVSGDLQVSGTTTTVNSTTVEIGDKNIVLGANATANSQNDGGGISILLPDPSPDEFATFTHTGTTWNLSDALSIDSGNLNIVSGNFQIAGTTVIDSSTNITTTGLTVNAGNSASSTPLNIIGSNSSYTSAAIKNTGTGDAILWFDGSNGDLADGDYASIRQANTGLHLVLKTEASGGSILLQPAGATALTLDTSQNATFEGTIAAPSGNIFVGKSDATLGTDGTNIAGTSTIISASSGNTYHVYNTNTSTYPFVVSFDGNVTSANITATRSGNGTQTALRLVGGAYGFDLKKTQQESDYAHFRPINDGSPVVLRLMPKTSDNFAYLELWNSDFEADTVNYSRGMLSYDTSNNFTIQTNANGTGTAGNIILRTNSTPALTLDTSQNATFASTVTAPAFVGTLYSNTIYMGTSSPGNSDSITYSDSEIFDIGGYYYFQADSSSAGIIAGQLFLGNNSTSTNGQASQSGLIRLGQGGSEASPNAAAGLEFVSSTSNNGYGWRIFNPDNTSGDVPLIIQRRVNAGAWTTHATFEPDGSTDFGGERSYQNGVLTRKKTFTVAANVNRRIRVTCTNYTSVRVRISALRTNSGDSIVWWEGYINNNDNTGYATAISSRNSSGTINYTFTNNGNGTFDWDFNNTTSPGMGTITLEDAANSGSFSIAETTW